MKVRLEVLAVAAVLGMLALSLPLAAETIIGGIDMGITKEVDKAAAFPGETLIYTLVATNYGEAGAREGYVVDVLPDGVTFVSVDDPACTHDAGVIECYHPLWLPITFDPDAAVRTIEVTVTIDADATGTLVNLARVENRDFGEGAPVDGDPTNDEATAETEVLQEVLGEIGDTVFEDTDGNGVQDAGEPGIPGAGVVLDVTDGSSARSTTDSSGRYLFPELAGGEYTVWVDETTLPEGFAFTTPSKFEVSLSDGESFLDADFGVDFPGPPPTIDIELTKTLDPAGAVLSVGDQATFVVTVVNRGPDDATGVVVADTLPPELVFNWGSADSGLLLTMAADGVVSWEVGGLPAGATAQLTVVATVTDGGSLTNVAEVVAASPADIDSTPGDGTGDDYAEADLDAVQVLAGGLTATTTLAVAVAAADGGPQETIPDTGLATDGLAGLALGLLLIGVMALGTLSRTRRR